MTGVMSVMSVKSRARQKEQLIRHFATCVHRSAPQCEQVCNCDAAREQIFSLTCVLRLQPGELGQKKLSLESHLSEEGWAVNPV